MVALDDQGGKESTRYSLIMALCDIVATTATTFILVHLKTFQLYWTQKLLSWAQITHPLKSYLAKKIVDKFEDCSVVVTNF